MKNYILSGYLFGAAWGVLYCFFRVPPKAGMTTLDLALGSLLIGGTVAGGIGAIAGLAMGLLAWRRERLDRLESRRNLTPR